MGTLRNSVSLQNHYLKIDMHFKSRLFRFKNNNDSVWVICRKDDRTLVDSRGEMDIAMELHFAGLQGIEGNPKKYQGSFM